MRLNLRSGSLALAATFAGTSAVNAQTVPAANPAAPQEAQADPQPAVPQPDPAAPQTDPATQPPKVEPPAAGTQEPPRLPEELLRKMIDEQLAKGVKPRVGDVSLHGYFRAGYGVSQEGGRQVCFQAPGAISKWRLGNECDLYGEFLFSAPAYVGDNGFVATANVMFNVYIPTTTQGYPDGFTAAKNELGRDIHWGTNQFYFDFAGVPFLGQGAHAWVGRRFYKRDNIDTIDYFWWNSSGLGGGFEDIPLGGPVKLSVAVFEADGPGKVDPTDPTIPSLPARNEMGLRPDIRVYGIPVPGGELVLGVNPVIDVSGDTVNAPTNTTSGIAATAMHVAKALGGTNKLAVQYGVGSAVGDNGVFGSLEARSKASFVRVLDHFDFQLSPKLGGNVLAVFNRYNKDTTGLANARNWVTAGARMSYAFRDNAALIADAGFDTVKDVGDRKNLFKLTVAPSLVANKAFWGRPQLRLFGTLATWNAAARAAGVDSGGIYTSTNKSVGTTFGIQGEAWW
jgi:maltoporin